MRVDWDEPCPRPADPVLAQAAEALDDGGHWGWIFDLDWRLVYMSDDARQSFGGAGPLAPLRVDEPWFGSAMLAMSDEWRFGPDWRDNFKHIGGTMLVDFAGDRDRMRGEIDPTLHVLVDQLSPSDVPLSTFHVSAQTIGSTPNTVASTLFRLRDADGALRGSVLIGKPQAGMFAIAAIAVQHDLGHLERMQQVISADRRPAAILFADLEGSSALARRLSTSSYFALTRRLVVAADRAVIGAGGLVGRHVGDGVVAFFPAVTFASESHAARACIEAARSIRDAARTVAERCDLEPSDLVMRFGLHWGSTLYIGGITTGARTEVTALGDEVNEAARIEASAVGGRTLASKQLLERLNNHDAAGVGLDPGHLTYVQLADLDGATDKARRDAPSVAVCEL